MGQLPKNNNVMHRKIIFFSVLCNGIKTFNLALAVFIRNEDLSFFRDFSRVLLL